MFRRSRRALAGLLTLAVPLVTFSACKSDVQHAAFEVDGLLVDKAELIYYMRDYSALVASELETSYGVDSSEEGFWGNTYGELVPIEYLKDYTVDWIARVKIEQLFAQEKGIETPLYWDEQHAEMERENEERRAAASAGEIVYGALERNFVAYFSNMYNAMRVEMVETLLDEGAFAFTDEEFRQYYADHYANGPATYEESLEAIRLSLAQEHYDAMVDARLENAEIRYLDMEVSPEEVE